MIIDDIKEEILQCIHNNIKVDTLIVSKDVEREMFLDGSFPKGDNYEDKISIHNLHLNFIVIEGVQVIKALGNRTLN